MERTSLGFHTITLYKKLTRQDARKLFQDFKSYAEDTGNIALFPIGKSPMLNPTQEMYSFLKLLGQHYYIANYPKQAKGLLWLWRFAYSSPGFIKLGEADKSCSIKVTVNPKILLGEKDYISASTENYLADVERLFNIEAKRISPILGEYKHYSISRPDYCVNFDLKELGIPCTSEQMIYLIKHGDIPNHYAERVVYDKTSKRNKADKDSFYLVSKSATINCYNKYVQLGRRFPDCPDMESSKDIIRFEVQCNYLKTYQLVKSIKEKQNMTNPDIIQELLSDDYCQQIIRDYFLKVVRHGDYFTLDGAIKQVQSCNFQSPKEDRLICALKAVNQFRGIHKVKAVLHGESLNTFNRSLNDLSAINVNPVTIPREWKIPRIPNLLDTYYDFISKEQNEKKNFGVKTEEDYFEAMLDRMG